jgi:nitrous oxidase accessory protein NosD
MPQTLCRTLCAATLVAVGLHNSAPRAGRATTAATLRVCASGCDHTTIQAAISAANPGDTIEIAGGVYTETLTIDKALTLAGGFASAPAWAPGPTGSISVIRGDGAQSVMTIGGAPTIPTAVTLRRLRVENGRGAPIGGGIKARFVGLTLSDSIVAGNTTTATIANDTALGAGLYLEAGALLVERTQFSENTVACLGLYCPITDGGGIYITGTQRAVINDSVFAGNIGWVGAGIASVNASLTISGTAFTSNRGAYGAGVHATAGVVTVTASSFSNNLSGQGGVFRTIDMPSAAVERSAFAANISGAAILETRGRGGYLRLVNNALLGETITFSQTGSAIIATSAQTSTIAHNTVAGASLLDPAQPLLLLDGIGTNHTVANNIFVSATLGISASIGTSYTLRNTIMDRVTTPLGGEVPVISATLLLTNPLLINARTDGRLRAGSPAIDAGATDVGIGEDLNGRPRDARPDIGAHEYVAVRQLFLPLTRAS